ncbi:MAG: hypothetical protein LC664_09820 [Flavobacteriales bacterium]|nr:hypothetical protein [Flavobacteriales bacterium]
MQYQRGKLRQINDYYPYGLTIAGLNSNSDEYLNKYTSKELQTGEFDSSLSTGLEMFDFGSRFYDPQLGVWFTPDPAEQFHNPYLGIGNNPVMYVDPDGEFVFTSAVIVGAMIGSFTGAMMAGYSGASPGQIMAAFGVGALSGAIGGATGQGMTNLVNTGMGFGVGFVGASVGSTSGFFAGAAVGASAGLAGGFTTGFGNAAIQGGNIGDMLDAGVEFGWKGAAAGAAIGGLSGGLKAVSGDKNFWTGSETTGSYSFSSHQSINYHHSIDEFNPLTERTLLKGGYWLSEVSIQAKISTFNINAAVNYITQNAYPYYIDGKCGWCARAVRKALEKGGINTNNHPGSAKDYPDYLREWGFSEVSKANYTPSLGDIRVIQPYTGGNQNGHINMFNGKDWISDFVENGFWPGPGYRRMKPSYLIFRW